MKYLKMLGLAAVLAAAVMAIVGAGTASADEICTEPAVSNMCPAGKLITEIDATLKAGESAKLEDTSGNTLDTCTAGTVKITNISQGTGVSSITGTSAANEIVWGEKNTECLFTTDTITGASIEATQASGGGTTLKASGAEVTINTGLFGSCIYKTGTGLDLGTVSNGGTTLTINVVVTRASGFACPSSAKWNATYTVTNHNHVYYIKN
jgi:hypothetical protein